MARIAEDKLEIAHMDKLPTEADIELGDDCKRRRTNC
jgi:hypothetical protein